MDLLHDELRAAREKAGLTQMELARRAGIPRNQIVRAERGENLTIDTLRRIAAQLPLTELSLLDTTGIRVDIIADPERLFQAALKNVLALAGALDAAIELTMETRAAVEMARTAAPPQAEGTPSTPVDPALLRNLERLAGEIKVAVERSAARGAPDDPQ